MTPYTSSLISAHRKVDEEIRREQQQRAPDPLKLLHLKKRRLAMKDRVHQLVAARQQEMA
jgi:uncharacterized protein YdcH (DUF465 family)